MFSYETHNGELSDEKQTLSESREKVANLQFQKEVMRVQQSPDVYDRDQRATVGVSTRGLEAYETEEDDRVLVIEDENKEVTRTEITYDSTETTPEKVLEAYTGGGGGRTLAIVISVVFVLVVVGALYFMRRRSGGKMLGSLSSPAGSHFMHPFQSGALPPPPPPPPPAPLPPYVPSRSLRTMKNNVGKKIGYGKKKDGKAAKKPGRR